MKYIQNILHHLALSHSVAGTIQNILLILSVVSALMVFVDAFRGKSSERLFAWIFGFFGLFLAACIPDMLDSTKHQDWVMNVLGIGCGIVLIVKIAANYRTMRWRRARGLLIGQTEPE